MMGGLIVACGSLILRWRRRFKERGLIKIARIFRARARCFSNFQFRKKEGTFYFLKFTSPPRAISHSWEAPLQVFPLHFLETPRPSPSTTNF
jgi:hypothetical protein